MITAFAGVAAAIAVKGGWWPFAGATSAGAASFTAPAAACGPLFAPARHRVSQCGKARGCQRSGPCVLIYG